MYSARIIWLHVRGILEGARTSRAACFMHTRHFETCCVNFRSVYVYVCYSECVTDWTARGRCSGNIKRAPAFWNLNSSWNRVLDFFDLSGNTCHLDFLYPSWTFPFIVYDGSLMRILYVRLFRRTDNRTWEFIFWRWIERLKVKSVTISRFSANKQRIGKLYVRTRDDWMSWFYSIVKYAVRSVTRYPDSRFNYTRIRSAERNLRYTCRTSITRMIEETPQGWNFDHLSRLEDLISNQKPSLSTCRISSRIVWHIAN